jgi:hypothetical protein
MYPLGRLIDDPSHPSVDVSVSTFLRLLLPDARSMTRSIMSGIICPPKVFVQRTLRRMRLLPKLSVLAHLSRLPPCMMEIENMGILSNIAGILMRSDGRLRDLFMKQGAPGVHMKSITSSVNRPFYLNQRPFYASTG